MAASWIPVETAEREVWTDLAGRYRWTYAASLQERLSEQVPDIQVWWSIGGQLDLTPLKPPRHQEERPRPVFADLPGRVQDVLAAVSADTGVAVWRILAGQHTKSVVGARYAAIRRLHVLPRADGRHPTSTQIAAWLGLDHTTVLRALKAR